MSVYADIQSLEPGAEVILFELDATSIGGDLARFHGYQQLGPIIWQGNGYSAWPIDADGFELNPDQPPTPTLMVGNVDGSITALCLAYQDLAGAVLVRHRTFGKYLDAANFPGGNANADSTQEFPPDRWFIEQKTAETNISVTFALSSALDFGQVQLPARKIVCNECPWGYRSPECGYTGPAVADATDTPTSNLALDACSKRLTGCKLRFGATQPLSFGGFPAASLTR